MVSFLFTLYVCHRVMKFVILEIFSVCKQIMRSYKRVRTNQAMAENEDLEQNQNVPENVNVPEAENQPENVNIAENDNLAVVSYVTQNDEHI